MEQIGEKEAPTKEIVQNEKLNCGKIRMNSTERNGELARSKAEWSQKKGEEWLEERSEQLKKFLLTSRLQKFLQGNKWTREADERREGWKE